MRIHLTLATFTLACAATAAPVISEIFYRPPGAVENPLQEWIEVRNPDALAVDVSGWKVTKGVEFTVPAATSIPAGGYLVIAADVAAFNAAHPGFAGTVIGGWTGTLNNSSQQVQLNDALGNKVCDTKYADAGDWALRGRGDLTPVNPVFPGFQHRGWDWFSGADGDGYSFELRNPALGIGSGQNWGVSVALGGSPGAANSVASANIAPLIKDAKHKPELPKSTEAVVVSANIEDEVVGATATLNWRLDGGTWAALPMTDTDGDGDMEATIPPQANLAVVEWYIAATDGANSRTWPAPARTSGPGVAPETFGQVANALYQVDNAFNAADAFTAPGAHPVYRLIMTNVERLELLDIGTQQAGQANNASVEESDSAAAMNGTFISHDGTGVKTRYAVGIRNRGQGSAHGPPNNYSVGFRTDDQWNGRSSMAINCRYGYLQLLGNTLVQRAGLATQEAVAVSVWVNGTDLAETGTRMYGRYARLEGRSGEWAEAHYPNDSEGNFYRLDDHKPGTVGVPVGNLGSGEFAYEGTDPAAYSDTFIKETNKEANDYSDLINFTRIVSAPITGGSAAQPAISDAAYPVAVAAVLDLENFYRYIATDTLLGNREGGLYNGRGDDSSMYRGLIDTRFRFIHHDLDTTFDGGDTTGAATGSIFTYDTLTGGTGLNRLFQNPQLVPKYYAALIDATNTWFNSGTADPIIDQLFTGWVPVTDAVGQNRSITDIKAYITARRNSVLGQIPQIYSYTPTLAAPTTGEGYLRTYDGAASFSGNFNVARCYSITVNGVLATTNYRTSAGTWSLTVPVGGGAVLHPGLNRVITRMWDAPNGTGNVLQTYTSDILFQPLTATYTNVAGTITAGSLRLTAPATYIPGKPFLVRADVLDGAGALDRSVWDGSVSLTTAAAGVTLPSIQLYNGVGSALVTMGGGSGGANSQFIPPGGTLALPNTSNPTQWRMLDSGAEPTATWKSDLGFDDSTWILDLLQAGGGDGDERRVLANVNTANTTRRAFYFRKKFNLSSVPAIAQLQIKAVIDDGAIFYLNGTQVKIDNMPAAPWTLTTSASTNRSGAAEAAINTFDISAFINLLVPGDNLLAVEVHNYYLAAPLTNSADLSFDCELLGLPPSSDPGNLTINGSYTAPGATFTASKAMTSLTPTPTITAATGTLAAGTTNWSGVIQVTGDVTVPTGSTLNIAAGTHVLVDGDATPGSTAGKRIIVNGTLNSNGTFAQPVAISSTAGTDRWGGFLLSAAQPSAMNYTLISRAGHTTGVGHTGRGPAIRLTGSSLNFDDSVIGDTAGKVMYTSGTLDLNIRRSLMERAITGPELEDGAALLIEDSNIQRILPDYRESNAAAPDDEDCLYVHNSAGRSVIIRRAVFARCGDDVFDCLGGPITVEDSILREGWDKGMSLLNNDLTITRTQIIRCDKAIVPKSQAADTRTVTANFVTIVSENHDTTLAPWGYSIPPTSPDPDSPSTGFYTQNKAGQSNAGATLAINAKNCIVIAQSPVLVDAPYTAAPTVLTYCNTANVDFSTFTWPGTGNITANPLFASTATGNYRITSTSPCRNTGDPTTTDPDTTRGDMGALYFGGGAASGGNVTWTAAGGPYRITANATVPTGTTLNIGPGTAVYFDQNTRLFAEGGRIVAQGTADQHIVFSHVPTTVAAGDADPIKNGTQTGPPKWGGVRIFDSLAQENIFRYCDFINAQGTDPQTSENYGSLGFIRSWGWADHVSFAGTHLRMLYGRNCSLTATYIDFPDMFFFDPLLNRIEEPTTDFLASADNKMEPCKVEHPTTDTELAGLTGPTGTFPNGLPRNGHWRAYFNDFHGNRGHQDVFDADSGRWSAPDATGFQSNGQFVLDCRYNHFFGTAGDEHIDLGGDAYIASNVFENATKDYWTNDTGYSNAISSGDKGTGTTIMVVRNICYDLDHVINCKLNTATIFEHNTVANLHADFNSVGATVTQFVLCAPINFYIAGDGGSPTYGDGAYTGFNIFSNMPRVFSRPDTRDSDPSGVINNVNDITTQIEFFHNLLDQIGDPIVGPNHPGGYFAGTFGPNEASAPGFVNPAAEDYRLTLVSNARRRTPQGFDYGADIPEWAYVVGGPTGTSDQPTANFTVGGPGIVAYKWRLDGGAWSAPTQIGAGGLLVRGAATVRQATIALSGLTAGTHTLEVLGQDMASNWQDADPARTYDGKPQLGPTVRTWTVELSAPLVRLSEILADSATLADTIELFNNSSAPVNVAGWFLTDDPLAPTKFPLPATTIPAGGYATFSSALLGLDPDGDAVILYQGGIQRDSVVFGHQLRDFTIGRVMFDNVLTWKLCTPTLGTANNWLATTDLSGIRISEWFSAGIARYGSDWIELSNSQAFPVDLAGLRITDNRAGAPAEHIMPQLSFIAASGYVKLTADSTTGGSHLSFSLDPQQDDITLFDTNGTFLDTVQFSPQSTDYSQGRDATGAYVLYELPTAGLANTTTDANALALLRGLRITQIMYNALGGSDFDYVELTNTGATALQLQGVKFVSGITFTFTAATTLNAGESIMVVKNLTKFRSRYGNAPVVAGTYTGNLSDGGEGVAIQLPPPFDANILTFDYADGWYASTDGLGTALRTVAAGTTVAQLWSDKDTWLASALGGNPAGASARTDTFSGWMTLNGVNTTIDDTDRDGLVALIECALGSNPQNGNGGHGIAGAPAAGAGSTYTFLVPQNAGAAQGHGVTDLQYVVQSRPDLIAGAWTTIATKTYAANWTGTVNIGAPISGFIPVTVTDPSGGAQRFFHLTINWAP